MEGLRQWWGQGRRVTLRVGARDRGIFVRRIGNGPMMTLLHGFPSSSHDWAKVVPRLWRAYALLMPDFLGFGASVKPAAHEYSLLEQADLVEALWAHEHVHSTLLVAHDYGVSVAQELLARRAEARLEIEFPAVYLLNGGLYPDLHRPLPTQTALLDPVQGPQLSGMLTEEVFAAGLAPTFAQGYDAAADSAEMWHALSHEGGQRIVHLLIRYIHDREHHARRWVGALEGTDVPLAFVWGMLDPISGAHMAERIHERLPRAPVEALDDVSHWPPLEAPERVATALLARPDELVRRAARAIIAARSPGRVAAPGGRDLGAAARSGRPDDTAHTGR